MIRANRKEIKLLYKNKIKNLTLSYNEITNMTAEKDRLVFEFES